MKLTLDIKERKTTYAELKTEYLYILIPFMLLVSVKLYLSSWQEIIISPDWSLASCLIFGQITSKVSKAIARTKCNTSEEHFGWYTAKRFLLVLVSAASYFGMLSKPTFELGVFQLFIFVLASYFHFKDGFTTKLLQKYSK